MVGIWALWNYGWRQYQLDMLRQGLFALRDELFDLVATKQINLDFGAPAYTSLRASFNKAIRFCHRLNVATVFWALVLARLPFWGGIIDIKSYKPQEESAIELIPDP